MVADYLNEADTRAKLIDPALHKRGWHKDLVRREQRPGRIITGSGKPRRGRKPTDYLLLLPTDDAKAHVAVAVVEAKPEKQDPWKGFDQAKRYAESMSSGNWVTNSVRHHVQFAFSTNGHRYLEFDRGTGKVSRGRMDSDFPSPAKLRKRYEDIVVFKLDSSEAEPLRTAYTVPSKPARYYQDAAVRAALEGIAKGSKRMMLSMATGTGKTLVAVQILKRLSDARQMQCALFLCDRKVLRQQGLEAMREAFGEDAAAATSKDPAKNARVIVATYQTLGIAGEDDEDDDAAFLTCNYPPNFFSHIIIDECHRSAWKKWSTVLTRNDQAVHIGLTATPRRLDVQAEQTAEDQAISANNFEYFGEPIFEYQIGHAMEDGYLAAMTVRQADTFIGGNPDPEREVGVDKSDLEGGQAKDARTGDEVSVEEVPDHHDPGQIERRLQLPDRVDAMCRNLFDGLCRHDEGPEQKSIIYCVSIAHAEEVAAKMEEIYRAHCAAERQKPADPYAFPCTSTNGSEHVPDFKALGKHHFVATTVDLLSTGVDVPEVRNIVFFRYVKSPILFHQIIGRGTRIDEKSGKLAFTIWDYTNATRLLGEDLASSSQTSEPPEDTTREPPKQYEVEGIQVEVRGETQLIGVPDGQGGVRTVDQNEYANLMRAAILGSHRDLSSLRENWIDARARKQLVASLLGLGLSVDLVGNLIGLTDHDGFDILAHLAFNREGITRTERSSIFSAGARTWMAGWPEAAQRVLLAATTQFRNGGIEALESNELWSTREVAQEGGIIPLYSIPGIEPAQAITEFKRRLFG